MYNGCSKIALPIEGADRELSQKLITMGAETSSPQSFFTGSKITHDYSDWMRGVNDSTRLSTMSIPGTHNSMAFHGGDMYACQTMALMVQLMAGIRFLDIGARHYKNGLVIHNGYKFQGANFGSALSTSLKFLKDHPSETILISIKKEHWAEHVENDRNFKATFQWYLSLFKPDPGNPDKFWTDSTTPTLGQVRGKIVIIDRVGMNIGINWDYFHVKDSHVATILPSDINGKRNRILQHLDRARSVQRNVWFVTFCSGYSNGAYPNAVANRINVHVHRYVERLSHTRLGIVAMDFPGPRLIRAIFKRNPGA